MFFKRNIILNFFLVWEVMIHISYGSDLKIRKQIYDRYVSLHKFEGNWIDPHSLGISESDLMFEEPDAEVFVSDQDETRESPQSFSRPRIFPKSKSHDGMLDYMYWTVSDTIHSRSRNLLSVSTIVTFVVLISYLFFPRTLMCTFVVILSVFWHWMKLYREKIAEKQNLTENLRHPNECRRGALHWYEIISLYLSSYASAPTDCKEYYKAQLVDPFWEVSLPVAMMNAFANTVCEPMKVFAKTVRSCCEVIFSGLTLLQLSITLFSIFIFFLMHYGYSFSFLWGGISLFRPRSYLVDQTVPQPPSYWVTIAKYLKSIFVRKIEMIHPLELSSPPNKDVDFPSKQNELKVSEKPDKLEIQEKSTDEIRQNATLLSRSLNLENNSRMDAIKIQKFRKYHKKSPSWLYRRFRSHRQVEASGRRILAKCEAESNRKLF